MDTYRYISATNFTLATYVNVSRLNWNKAPLVMLKDEDGEVIAIIHLAPGERLVQVEVEG